MFKVYKRCLVSRRLSYCKTLAVHGPRWRGQADLLEMLCLGLVVSVDVVVGGGLRVGLWSVYTCVSQNLLMEHPKIP